MKKDLKITCKRAFSVAEATVVLIIMAGIILLVGRIALGDKQKEYDAKFNKVETLISANITKDLVENTGTEFADYASIEGNGNKYFRSAVVNNLVKNINDTCTNCWGSEEVRDNENNKTYEKLTDESGDWSFYELKDKTVMAVSKERTERKIDKTYYKTDVIVDVNGKKGPNVLGKDIKVYNYPYKTCNHMSEEPWDNYLYIYEENLNTCDWDKKACRNADKDKYDRHYNDKYESIPNSRIVKVQPSLENGCMYDYYCKTTDNDTYKSESDRNLNAKMEYKQIQSPEKDNDCVYLYDKKCKTDEAAKKAQGYYEKFNKYLSFDNVNLINASVDNDCTYDCNCEGKAIYESGKAKRSNYDKTIANEVGEEPSCDNNCTGKYEYPCIPEKVVEKGRNSKYDGLPYIEPITISEATIDNGCQREIKYQCSTKEDVNKDDKIIACPRVKTDIEEANIDNECKNIYNYSCEATIDEGRDDTIAGYERVKTDIEDATPENCCINKYTYSCAVTDYEEGKDEEKAQDPKFVENKEDANTSNMCINKYTYSCNTNYTEEESIIPYNEETVNYNSSSDKSRNNEESQNVNPVIGNNTYTVSTGACGYTYTYTCKNPKHIFGVDTEAGGFSCSCSTGNRPKDDGHVKWSADNNCIWTVECPSGLRYANPTITAGGTTKYTYKVKNTTSIITKTNQITSLVSCPCKNARVSDAYIDTTSVYTGSPKAPTRDPDTCEWTYYCKNEKLNIEGTGTSTTDKIRCECGEDNITEKNNTTFNQAKEDLYNANKGKMSNGKKIATKPTSSNNCTRIYGYTYICKVLTDNETYNAIPEEIRNNACGIGTNGLNSDNCSTTAGKEKKYKITFNNNFGKDATSCTYTYTTNGGKPVCNPNYNKDKFYDTSTVAAVQNPDTCEWEYNCLSKFDLNYVEKIGTGAANTTADRIKCQCKTQTNNPSYDENKLRAIYGDKFDDYAKETLKLITDKNYSCHYVYECKISSLNKSYNATLYGLNGKKSNQTLRPMDATERPCQYDYECRIGTQNDSYYGLLHQYFNGKKLDFTDYVNETLISKDENTKQCAYSYVCKYRTDNKSYNDLSSEIKNNTCYANDPQNNNEKCNTTVGKTKKYQLNITAVGNANAEKCIYKPACNSNYAAITNDFDTNTVLRSQSRNKINYTGNVSSVAAQQIVVDKGACDYIYTYKCERKTETTDSDGNTKIAYVQDKNRKIQFNEETQKYECPCTNTSTHAGDIRWQHKKAYNQNCGWRCNDKYVGPAFKVKKGTTKILLGGQDTGFDSRWVNYKKSGKNAYDYKKDTNARKASKIIEDKKACDFIYTYTCKEGGTNKSYSAEKHNNQDMTESRNAITAETNPCKYSYGCVTGSKNSTYNDYKQIKAIKNLTFAQVKERGYLTEEPTVSNGCIYKYCPGGTQGYDQTYHNYSKQSIPRVVESVIRDKNNKCIYSYRCGSILKYQTGTKGSIISYQAPDVSNNCVEIIRYSDPIVLDLKGNGIKFTTIDDGVLFDIDGDGTKDQTAWTAAQNEFDDAFLVIDKNGDGQINNVNELLSDQNGNANGLLELATYDENEDGIINEEDPIFEELLLWSDMNKNGVTDSGELKTLSELGITEISTSYTTKTSKSGSGLKDEYGNDISTQGTFKQIVEEIVDGVQTIVEKIGNLIDVLFNFITGLFTGEE